MYMKPYCLLQSMAGAAMAIALMSGAQTPATPPATAPAPADASAPLSTFVLTGPLTWLPPATFDAGLLGKLSVNGIVTGFSVFQNNPVDGDDKAQATLSNGQIFIQKADGKVQYYIQAGAYTMPTLSTTYNAGVEGTFGSLPFGIAKLRPPTVRTPTTITPPPPAVRAQRRTLSTRTGMDSDRQVWTQKLKRG